MFVQFITFKVKWYYIAIFLLFTLLHLWLVLLHMCLKVITFMVNSITFMIFVTVTVVAYRWLLIRGVITFVFKSYYIYGQFYYIYDFCYSNSGCL